ncbi:MAG TPA: ferritin-like domain-containing protein [Acidimicrobiia bacterium]|nr:ferritin-like domain-containing protein [Acidimicrobiia bacterium]
MPIDSIQALREHVALARQVEMSTIPPYLYAAYSIKGETSEARDIIISVVVEEMLHLALTTNLLLALGGEPDFDALIPHYPSLLAHHTPDLLLELKRCTPEVITDTFMVIERPEAVDAPPEADDYETLGQFYAALELAIHELGGTTDLFADHRPDRQLADPSFYGPVAFDAEDSGGLMLIGDIDSACAAIDVIVDQGEGLGDHLWADPEHRELTHYHKFIQLADGTMPIGETWPVADNPKVVALPEEIRPAAQLFNAMYMLLFDTMKRMYSPGADQGAEIGRLYTLMSDGLAPVARLLVTLPVGGGMNAGPTFERYAFTEDPVEETIRLADAVAVHHPEIRSVAEALRSAFPE